MVAVVLSRSAGLRPCFNSTLPLDFPTLLGHWFVRTTGPPGSKIMKSQDIRKSFIQFFEQRGHRPMPSAPLVTQGDPTLMFNNAGMVQFKSWFLGQEEPASVRVVTAQKCLRVSGKHNDLENVGPSLRHHTFFEMLGNFSFGDYFKEEAIRFGWELVTEVWGLPVEHLFATVFEEDSEAETLWRKISTLPAERIVRCGAKDNFWAMGETGPCGPCSEIFVDIHPEQPKVPFEEGDASGRYLEIWNLVFMQYERDAEGKLSDLPNPSIDTGAGLERVAAVLQGVKSNYDSDVFRPLLRSAAALASTEYGKDAEADVSLRVVADHLRAVSFLLADGVIPGPDGSGYVLRRLLRRAVRHGMRLGFEEPFLHRLVPVLEETMGSTYQELTQTAEATVVTVREEEEKYLSTRATGARRVQEAIDRTRAEGGHRLSGKEMFNLYETYGLEIEALREIAQEERLGLDEKGFQEVFDEERSRARAVTSELQKRLASLREALEAGGEVPETKFRGYQLDAGDDAAVLRLARLDGEGGRASATEALESGAQGVVVLDSTPFYAESGGQVGDVGDLCWEGGRARVHETRKDNAGVFFHFVQVEEGILASGARISPRVDGARRLATERNHTATHLLHAALHKVLGEGARQAGSLVAPDRLRFDFTFGRPVTSKELERIEDLAGGWVQDAVPTRIQIQSRKAALERGAMALFGEKYGDEVRTVEVPGVSLELCGGCHVRNSGEIGPVLITSERGVASGVRRIEAITGEGARAEIRRRRSILEDIERELGAPADRAAQEVGKLKTRVKELEKELSKIRQKLLTGQGSAEASAEKEVEGVKLVAREVPPAPKNELRNLADTLRDQLGSGVVVLGSRDEGKVTVIVTVSKDLTKRLSAGKLVAELATFVGGRGGGRPDFAQAGGKDTENLPQLLEAAPGVLAAQLGASS
jgi:alanyl-tRNA synthetase